MEPPPILDPDQQHAVDLVLHGSNVFITGKAGSGKSLVIGRLREALPETAICLSSTGMAARHIGGATIHSFFHFPPTFLPHGYVAELRFDQQEVLNLARTFIIDEVSMVRSDVLAAIDATLRHYARPGLREVPFGGKQIVAVGDFFQLAPVVVGMKLRLDLDFEHGGYLAFESPSWQQAGFHNVELRQSHRQAADQPFLEALDCLREGRKVRDDDLRECMAWINARVRTCDVPPDKATVLCTTRRDAAAINRLRALELRGPVQRCVAKCWGEFEPNDYPTDRLLELKEGGRVMLLANGTGVFGTPYVNGDTGYVLDYDTAKERAEVQLDDGRRVTVGRFTWVNERYRVVRNPGSRRPRLERETIGGFSQLPMRQAEAITIHKSQGLTLERAHVHFGRGMFAFGQLYTALSRCRSLADLSLSRNLVVWDAVVGEEVAEFHRRLELGRDSAVA
jgi:ATP-dependent DNA helicase PIF1